MSDLDAALQRFRTRVNVLLEYHEQGYGEAGSGFSEAQVIGGTGNYGIPSAEAFGEGNVS